MNSLSRSIGSRLGSRFVLKIRCLSGFAFLCIAFACALGCGKNEIKRAENSKADRSRPIEVSVAAAADLKFAMDDLVSAFERTHPDTKLKVTYGSSGSFFAQLSHGAPFDIYFSADMEYARKLVEQGLALKETEFRYAVGQIVVWVPNSSRLDVQTLGIEALADSSVRKVAIANPKHAPYGRAAEAAMKHFGVYDRLRDRLVLGENIAQAAQFVETGAADIGVLALALALSPEMRDKGRYWIVPLEAYPSLEQGGVILSWVRDWEAASAFRSFVLSDQGGELLKQYGFLLPEN